MFNQPPAESSRTHEKLNQLVDFLIEMQVPSGSILVHGSFALELMGFIAEPGDIDLVCLNNDVFLGLSTRLGVDPANPNRIVTYIGDPAIEIEIFREWQPPHSVSAKTAQDLLDGAMVYFIPSQTEFYFLIPPIAGIIAYKLERMAKGGKKSLRDQQHLASITDMAQRDLLLQLLNTQVVTKDTLGIITGLIAEP